ncbi:MAG: hypothetical protein H7141_00720 [Burkholderiales bacterium]|nr:hypothetical protein [Bacteroidia bacterium]
MGFKFYLFVFIVLNLNTNAGTCTAIASTNFTLASTWSCGYVPTGYDYIVIPSGFTVTINSAVNLTSGGPPSPTNTILNISGVLFFSGNASKLDLVASAAIIINTGGKITTDQNNSSQKINIGTGPSEWNSSMGNLSGPLLISNDNLPVELIDFSGTCVVNGVQLNWSTATEVDNEYFLVEKSLNGAEWQFVAKVQGNGTTGTVHNYIHTDYGVNANDLTYYRLSQIDYNQTSEVFKTIDVNCDDNIKDQMILFSNPASTELNIFFSVKNTSLNSIIKLINNIGQTVMETKIDLNKGLNSFVFPIDLNSGTYHVMFSSESISLPSQKLLILK